MSNEGVSPREAQMLLQIIENGQKRGQKIDEDIAGFVSKGQLSMPLGTQFVSWDDAGRMKINGQLSFYGNDIADTFTYAKSVGKWMPDGPDASDVESAMLNQQLTRVANGEATMVSFTVEKDGMTGTGYAVNTYDDDVVVFQPSGKAASYFLEGENLKSYPINSDRESSGYVEEATLLPYVKSALKAPSKQTLIMDGDVPQCIVRHSAKEATVINYGGVGKHQKVSLVGSFDVPTFVIRPPNLNEKLVEVPTSRMRALVETEKGLEGNTVEDVLENIGKYMPHSGVAPDANISKGNEMCKVRVQAVILPEMEGGKTEYYNAVNHYQTHNDAAPRTLFLHMSPIGTSLIPARKGLFKLQPNKYDKETDTLSSFCLKVTAGGKKADDQYYSKDDKQKQAERGVGVASVIGPVTLPAMTNISVAFQAPLAPTEVANRSLCEVDDDITFGSLGDGGSLYRSLSALPEGEVQVSELSYGAYEGDANKVPLKNPKRHESITPTATVTLYFTLKAPPGSRCLPGECVVSAEDTLHICKKIEKVYELMGDVKDLADADAKLAVEVDYEKSKEIMDEIEHAAKVKNAVKGGEAKAAPPAKKRRGLVAAPVVAAMA